MCRETQDDPNRCKLGHWCKRFFEVDSIFLQKALGHKSCLVSLDKTFDGFLHLEHPLAADGFASARQWDELRAFCRDRGIGLIGDIPIFVSFDSVDVWAHQKYFWLGADGKPTVVAGVPPDYFNPNGQRWGNALYQWDALRADDYEWWVSRFRRAFSFFEKPNSHGAASANRLMP